MIEWFISKRTVVKNWIGVFAGIMLGFFLDASAHEGCLNDINSANEYYEKSVNYKKNNKLEHAMYSAKMFQLEAYEFNLVCKEKLKLEANEYSYEEILEQLIQKEKWLREQGLLKDKLLTTLPETK